ncbi:hypothetical protein IL306_014694 [Fusarium sp. DS 682]|nr:hypothetical protein IL306_014694 [Fusarium sp. DS 682]
MSCDGRLRLKLNVVVAYCALFSSIFAPLVLSSMRSRMARLIKVRDVVMMSKRVIAWSHPPMGRLMTEGVPPWALVTTMRFVLFMWRCAPTPCALLMRLAALVRLLSPASTAAARRVLSDRTVYDSEIRENFEDAFGSEGFASGWWVFERE